LDNRHPDSFYGFSGLIVEAVRPTALDLVSDLSHLGFARAIAAETPQEALDFLASDKPDVVLVDTNLAFEDEGFDVASEIGRLHHVPIVFFSSDPIDKELQRTMEGFPFGFFGPPFNPEEIRRALKRSLANHARGSATEKELTELRVTDALTGLGNSRKLQRCLDHEWSRCGRDAVPLAVLAVEVDRFAAFEKAHDQAAADEGLVQAANALRSQCFRRRDTVLHLSGPRFMAVLPATDAVGARHVAAQILEAFRGLREERPAAFPFSVSIGIAVAVPSDGEIASALVRKAEFSLESAKIEGGDRAIGAYVPASAATSPVVSSWLKSILRQQKDDATKERRRHG
jgi:diguanylate cyclase (GGDEF)-like protein